MKQIGKYFLNNRLYRANACSRDYPGTLFTSASEVHWQLGKNI